MERMRKYLLKRQEIHVLCYQRTRLHTSQVALRVGGEDLAIPKHFPNDRIETGIRYRPSQVQACMRDVPINKTLAVEQIKWMQHFVQFQSTLAYLKDPPPTYALPAIDIVGRLDEIAAKADAEQYHGEYEFEVDIADVFDRACDGHLNYMPFLIEGISYFSNQQIVSISLDGQELPKVYTLCKLMSYVEC